MPELLDAPELAQEVAKLEGLPGAWIEMEAETLTREAEEQSERLPNDIDL